MNKTTEVFKTRDKKQLMKLLERMDAAGIRYSYRLVHVSGVRTVLVDPREAGRAAYLVEGFRLQWEADVEVAREVAEGAADAR